MNTCLSGLSRSVLQIFHIMYSLQLLFLIGLLIASRVFNNKCCRVDVYWWGLRDVNITRKPCVVLEIDDLTLKSDVIVDNKANCNFPKGRVSEVFESLISDVYIPTLSIRLYDSSTFGRTLFLGSNVVNHLNKYIVNWMSLKERHKRLNAAAISSNIFCHSELVMP